MSTRSSKQSVTAELRPLSTFLSMLGRELRLTLRKPADFLNPLFFFAMVVTLFPVAVSPLPDVLRVLGPGVVWVAVLLAALLPLNTLFGRDHEDGTLEYYALSGQSLAALAFAKIVALWLVGVAPLVLASALVARSYLLPAESVPILLITLSLGGYSLCAIGAVAAGLTIGVQRASALIALLVLPLMIPIMIFGTRAISLSSINAPLGGAIELLAAIAILATMLAPLATAAAVRISLE
ncbi:MAG: heme exporter protein CcmB [Pseudomonadota bacterium]